MAEFIYCLGCSLRRLKNADLIICRGTGISSFPMSSLALGPTIHSIQESLSPGSNACGA